jgi:hypothetical protein
MKLWLDDDRDPNAPEWRPGENYRWVKTVPGCIHLLGNAVLQGSRIEALSLDNDLGEGQEEGYKVVLWLCEAIVNGSNFWPVEKPEVHSGNIIRKKFMEDLIERYGPYND